MMNDFIERDFTVEEMYTVISALRDVIDDQHLIELNRKYEEWERVMYWKDEKSIDKAKALKVLAGYCLDYKVEDLI